MLNKINQNKTILIISNPSIIAEGPGNKTCTFIG